MTTEEKMIKILTTLAATTHKEQAEPSNLPAYMYGQGAIDALLAVAIQLSEVGLDDLLKTISED